MRVLVTGAGGQLGRDIVRLCRERAIPVCGADSKALDITNYQAVGDYLHHSPCDVVINCAAYNAVDRAETDWRRAYLVNGIGVRNLALAMNSCQGVLVHYSTDYVFDGEAKRPYTIADTPHPVNRYGESKLLGERYVRDLADSFFLIRTSWVFGTGNVNFVKKMMEWSRNARELKVVEDQVSSPTYTADLAKATLDLLGTGLYGTYHVTNSGSCSRFEWAAFILDRTGWDGTLSAARSGEFATAARRPGYSVLDNFGTEETLGYLLPGWEDATERFLREVSLHG